MYVVSGRQCCSRASNSKSTWFLRAFSNLPLKRAKNIQKKYSEITVLSENPNYFTTNFIPTRRKRRKRSEWRKEWKNRIFDPSMLQEAQRFHREIVFDGIGAGLAALV